MAKKAKSKKATAEPQINVPATIQAALRLAAVYREGKAAVIALIEAIRADGGPISAAQVKQVKKAFK